MLFWFESCFGLSDPLEGSSLFGLLLDTMQITVIVSSCSLLMKSFKVMQAWKLAANDNLRKQDHKKTLQ